MTPRIAKDRDGQILDAASRVFAKLGFGPARMDDVASESGLSKGALYLYFKGKDQLIDALVIRMIELEMRRLQAVRSSTGPVPERLDRFVRDYTKELERMAPLGPIVIEVYARATRHRTVRVVLRRYFESYREELAALVAEGIARGEFRETDPDTVAVSIIALLEGMSVLWVLDRDRVPISRIGPTSFDLLMNGLRPVGPPSTKETP